MRNDDPLYKLIDEYLGNKLSDKENREFEQRINEDLELKEEVFNRKVANELIVEDRYFEIAKAIRNAPTSNPPSITSWIKKILGVGSVIAVICILIYVFNNSEKKEKDTTLESEDKTSKEISPDNNAKDEVIEKENEATQNKDVRIEQESTNKKATDDNTIVPENKTAINNPEGSVDSSYSMEISIDDAEPHAANSFSFNPGKGESWTIPTQNTKGVHVKIFNNAGKEVFHSLIQDGRLTKWNGVMNDGSKLEAGKYTYLLDFSNGEVEHGSVTIVN